MFKFTIRETVLLTTIVALCVVLWMEKRENANHETRLKAIETRLQTFPTFGPIVPVVAQPPAISFGPTVSAPPATSSRRVVIPKDVGPAVLPPPSSTETKNSN